MPVIDLSDGGAPQPSGAAHGSASLLDAPVVSLEQRIIAATLRCVSRWGVAKTTLDDIARDAGCSRATVYRVFPGGKDVVLLAALRHETEAVLRDLEASIAGAATLQDVLARSLATSVAAIRSHEALQYLVEHEPGIVLPWVAFDGLDPLLAFVADVLTPHTARFLPERAAREVAEALCRLVISYAFESTDSVPADLARVDEAERFVTTYLIPGYLVAPDLVAGPHPSTVHPVS